MEGAEVHGREAPAGGEPRGLGHARARAAGGRRLRGGPPATDFAAPMQGYGSNVVKGVNRFRNSTILNGSLKTWKGDNLREIFANLTGGIIV